MDYVSLEEAGRLHVTYDGPTLDLGTWGLVQTSLHEIIETVALHRLIAAGVIPSGFDHSWEAWGAERRAYRSWGFSRSRRPRILRATVERVETGSIEQEVAFSLVAVLADPDVRGVLQGLGGAVLHSVLQSGVQVVREKARRPRQPEETLSPESIPEVGANVRAIALAMADVCNGRSSELLITHRRGKEEWTVELKVNQEVGK